jgi:hypothetical protein
VSKFFETILLTRLEDIVDDCNALPCHRFGFRAWHSCVQQLILRVIDTIACGLENKKHNCAVFLDVTAAFDKVWYPGLGAYYLN